MIPHVGELVRAEPDRVAHGNLTKSPFVTEIGKTLYHLIQERHCVKRRCRGAIRGVLIRSRADLFVAAWGFDNHQHSDRDRLLNFGPYSIDSGLWVDIRLFAEGERRRVGF